MEGRQRCYGGEQRGRRSRPALMLADRGGFPRRWPQATRPTDMRRRPRGMRAPKLGARPHGAAGIPRACLHCATVREWFPVRTEPPRQPVGCCRGGSTAQTALALVPQFVLGSGPKDDGAGVGELVVDPVGHLCGRGLTAEAQVVGTGGYPDGRNRRERVRQSAAGRRAQIEQAAADSGWCRHRAGEAVADVQIQVSGSSGSRAHGRVRGDEGSLTGAGAHPHANARYRAAEPALRCG